MCITSVLLAGLHEISHAVLELLVFFPHHNTNHTITSLFGKVSANNRAQSHVLHKHWNVYDSWLGMICLFPLAFLQLNAFFWNSGPDKLSLSVTGYRTTSNISAFAFESATFGYRPSNSIALFCNVLFTVYWPNFIELATFHFCCGEIAKGKV